MVQREKFQEIRHRLGLTPPDVRSGSTVLADDVDDVAAALGVPPAGSIQKTWLAIIEALGGVPEDSDISHPGSGTITDQGFDKVLEALNLLDTDTPEVRAVRATATYPAPQSEAGGRRRVFVEVTRRQGQPLFRKALLDAYGGACCMSQVGDQDSLEAAHIRQYNGPQTNAISNGLLLRADLHTLFDRGLITVDAGYRVIVSDRLANPIYRDLHGRPLHLPQREVDLPDQEALNDHRTWSGLDA